MTDPILRIPLSEAAAHRAELAAAKARIADLEAFVRQLALSHAALQADRDGLANDLTFEAEHREAEDAANYARVRRHAEAARQAGLDVEPIGTMAFMLEQIEAEWLKVVPSKLTSASTAAPKPVDTRAVVAPDILPDPPPDSDGTVVISSLGNGPTARLNAALIAAAPELLAALEGLFPFAESRVEDIIDESDGAPIGDTRADVAVAAIVAARAAIAKAKGGAR